MKDLCQEPVKRKKTGLIEPCCKKIAKKSEYCSYHKNKKKESKDFDKKILIEKTNEIFEEEKERDRKTILSNNDENKGLKINVEKDKIKENEIDVIYSKNINNKEEKIKILFKKIDELCNILNEKNHVLD